MIEMGRYCISIPLLPFKPRLILMKDNDTGKVSGFLRWWGKSIRLVSIHQKDDHLIFQFLIQFIVIDFIVYFPAKNMIDGFFDTPIGHYRFKGKRMRKERL